jgi:geranylgeranyl pyrophosphate synthase
MTDAPQTTLEQLLADAQQQVNADLERWLILPDTPDALADAMRYCVLDVGKRIRPAMVYFAAQAVGGTGEDELTRRSAVAVELVHNYSLVHDDLPAMDDDELRHGKATVHVVYGEAMAILVGDALLTRAFGVLTETGSPRGGPLAAELSAAAGAGGMIAGQVADMDLCTLPAGPEALWYIHQRKTAALLQGAVGMGVIAAGGDETAHRAVREFARCLGLAYQVTDDLLDVTGSAADLGKTPGKDAIAGKTTSVEQLGPQGARRRIEDLTRQAADALVPLGKGSQNLALLADLLIGRTY